MNRIEALEKRIADLELAMAMMTAVGGGDRDAIEYDHAIREAARGNRAPLDAYLRAGKKPIKRHS